VKTAAEPLDAAVTVAGIAAAIKAEETTTTAVAIRAAEAPAGTVAGKRSNSRTPKSERAKKSEPAWP
jgi:hypothetical protein